MDDFKKMLFYEKKDDEIVRHLRVGRRYQAQIPKFRTGPYVSDHESDNSNKKRKKRRCKKAKRNKNGDSKKKQEEEENKKDGKEKKKKEEENKDEDMWNPVKLSEEEVDDYLDSMRQLVPNVRSEAELLKLLHDTNYDKKKALLGYESLLTKENGSKTWSGEECTIFEKGLEKHGKDFKSIQKEIQTKTLEEVIYFYYVWKKSERFDVFIRKNPEDGSHYRKTQQKKMYRVTDFADLILEQELAKLKRKRRVFTSSSMMPVYLC
ncbi:mesoderm induction early response protein 1 [Caerostris darwini]|uniref:Mesoderm induction early response protein 1 n=1 Tax=Caerostris darwini TaxID=1538125 RepID=A0AAV4TCJ4_9ARAC|nr:mesoderm induction early response protein 1 [Caerostris darwini]